MNKITIIQMYDFEARIKTIIVTADGVEIMEIHRKGYTDSMVLQDLLNRNYFQHMKGAWSISFQGVIHVIQRDSLESAIAVAQEYIYNRDNKSHFMDLFD